MYKARKIYESPDEISWPNLRYNKYGEAIDDNQWSPEFGDKHSYPFWYENGEFVLGREYSGHPIAIGRNDEGSFSGRVWADRKLISFWSYPSKFQFLDIAKELSERLSKGGYDADIINDPEWKVEVLPFGNWRDHWEDFQTELVSAKDYSGSGRRSQMDLGREHSKSPLDPSKKSPPKYIKKRDIRMRYAMGENQLVPETLEQLFEMLDEGVADKYAQAKFGIPDPEEEFEREYQKELASKSGEEEEKLYVKGIPIVKNPKGLKNFPPAARGVITRSGDVYMVPDNGTVIHQHIIDLMRKKGILKNKKDWQGSVWETNPSVDYIGVQKAWKFNILGLSESYALPKPKFPEEREEALQFFAPFFKAASSKNPNLVFDLENAKTIVRNMKKEGKISQEQYQESLVDMGRAMEEADI